MTEAKTARGDYRAMYDSKCLHCYDLSEKEEVLTIKDVRAGTLTDPKTKKVDKKCVLFFEEYEKPWAIPKVAVGAVIARLYGNEVSNWVGKKIRVYQTTTDVAGTIRECMRVRPEEVK